MDPRGTVGSMYKGEYDTLVHTTYERSGPYGFGEDFVYVFPIVSLRELLTPQGGAISYPRGMVGRIYVKLHIAMLHIYKQIQKLWLLWFQRRSFFHVFSIVSLWQIMMRPGRGLYGPQGHD